MAWRYDVVRFQGAAFGLAVAGGNTVTVLRGSGRAVRDILLDVARPRGSAVVEGASPRPGDTPITLFHLNPSGLVRFSPAWRGAVDGAAPAGCVPFWELPLLPASWVPLLGAMQVVLAPTRFVADACARALPAGRVIHHPQAVFLPGGIAPDRARWGIPSRGTCFLLSFDPGSDVERKNPWAGIEAFRRAFRGGEDVHLVVKTRPAGGVAALQEQNHALRDRARGDARIRVLEEDLAYQDVLRLYASCDVMVSLHRSEGLGLHLMEAMSLGRVVVGTDWSGNRDFMEPSNAVPVGCRLVPIAPRHPEYMSEVGRPGQVWAEADQDAAAAALAALHADPSRRDRLGRAAAASMDERRRRVLRGGAFDEVEGVLAGAAGDPAGLGAALRAGRRGEWRRRLRSLLERLGTPGR
jgi:hypothetical protein